MILRFMLPLVLLCLLGASVTAAEVDLAVAGRQQQPQPSEDSSWVGVLLIVVLGMFLAAAVVGPAVRANMPEEAPPQHSHDEHAGTSGHHGAQGAHDAHGPGHGHGHGHGH
jgi:hypothetical protein